MHALLQTLSWLALAGTVATPVLYYGGTLSEPWLRDGMLVATLLWFGTAPFRSVRARRRSWDRTKTDGDSLRLAIRGGGNNSG